MNVYPACITKARATKASERASRVRSVAVQTTPRNLRGGEQLINFFFKGARTRLRDREAELAASRVSRKYF